MKDEQDPINELYRKILQGAAGTGDKEMLARWMARLDVGGEEVSDEELAIEQQASQQALHARFFPPKKHVRFKYVWLAAASIAMVIFSAIFFYNKHSKAPGVQDIVYAENSTASGERKIITLEDGSRISMNSASHIRYTASFTGKSREVYLEGQAYFEVSHDKDHPFIVHAGKLAVEVLGTAFDVRNYQDDADAAVTVTTGKIAVKAGASSDHYVLTRGQQLTYDRQTGSVSHETVGPAEYVAWQQGAFVFREKELREVCRQLERIYGVTIHIKTPALEKKTLNFRIKGENISHVMEMLAASGGFQYSIKERVITLWK
ncbi:DUF4974 domain-containing protein [Chitinophaga agrisoli]|uniref:DUF4974 domain-containing protein n=1 Tax=Chitinophaga agrisoli TaxID=2607653 RepID=A0A5B2VVH9_9BACT|nr:FecR family protein [Chitinophaga agrisoli]KAA2243823.1 DUF4974 domain-containing protein [Chitinophaga agrisoli]